MNDELESLLRSDFLSFARKALREVEGVKLGQEPYLDYLAYELELFAAGDTLRLLVNTPPGHLKTSLGSVSLAAWLLADDPSLKIIIVSHAEHLSTSIARKIRSILQSPWFKQLFTTRIKRGHSAVTDFGTTAGGGVFVTSFQAGFTGRRANVILVDDPHDITDEIEQIEATIGKFDSVLLSRLNKNAGDDRDKGRVLVIAHRVHERDLSAHLTARRKWRHVVLPMIATKDQTYQTTKGQWHRKRGEILRPDCYSPEDLEDLRESSLDPPFGMLYQQDVESQGLPAFTRDDFPTFSATTLMPGPVVLSVDAAMSSRPRSAYSVIQVWCLAGGCYFLLDQFREQIDFTGLRDEVRRLRKIYRPVAILIERAANGHALISDLSRRFGQLIRPIDPDGRSKTARLLAHAATIKSRHIYLPAGAPWLEAYVHEFLEFRRGRFSDQVDATTQLLGNAGEFAGMPFSSGERAIVGTASGRNVFVGPAYGGERGLIGVARYVPASWTGAGRSRAIKYG
jgi:predicted phage terminase large subunit-like protein